MDKELKTTHTVVNTFESSVLPEKKTIIADTQDFSELPVPIQQCCNCNNYVYGKYCHSCGQMSISLNRPLQELGGLLFDSWFSLDNKIIRSIRPLLFKPGKLSAEFVSGRRTFYTSPLRMFVFSSLLYFFILGFASDNREIKITSDTEITLSTPGVPKDISPIETVNKKSGSWMDRKLTTLSKNPHRLTQRVNNALSYMFFVLMPLFAWLLKIILKRKKRLYFEHLIFSIHFHTFLFIFLTLFNVYLLIIGRPLPYATWMMSLGILFYLLLAMMNFYKMRWWTGVIRVFIVTCVYMVLFILVMASSIIFSILV